jgi:osmotically-inducible protein OsmY
MDPATVPSRDDPQGAKVAAGFAMSMEEADIDVEDLPAHVDDNDLDLQEDGAHALRYNSETAHLGDIAVHVSEGVVYLLGSVPNDGDVALVFDIAAGMEGVVRVVDHRQVGP